MEAFMKKSTLFLVGMAALLLSFGLVLVGCETDANDDSGIPAELVGVWYVFDGDANEEVKFFEITSNGKALMGEGAESFELDVTVSGGNITFSAIGMTFMEIKSYTVEDKQLKGTFVSYEDGTVTQTTPDATFYKK
jgi:hypothetical protein